MVDVALWVSQREELGQFIYYVIQEIYWKPEGSTENVLDLFPVGKACLKDATASCY